MEFIWRMEDWFFHLGRLRAFALGVVIGLTLTVPAVLIAGNVAILFPMAVYSPFHGWLILTGFGAALFAEFRMKILRRKTHPIGGFFGRFFSSYGLFCIGWFYSAVGVALANVFTAP